MIYQVEFEKYYNNLSKEERDYVDRKVMQVWADHILTDDMVRAVALKLLTAITVNILVTDGKNDA